MSQTITLLYVTCRDEAEAERIAADLIEKRLAACANILPGTRSVYIWKGALETSQEAVMIVKTTTGRAKDCAERIRASHSYEVPCVLPIEVDGSDNPFADWLRGELKS